MKMTARARAVFLTALFSALILLGVLAALLLPDRSFSENENRYLAKFPAFTLSTVFSGKFMKEFETYVSDQFPGRDGWVQLKAEAQRAMGKLSNNSVYYGKSGYLLQKFQEPGEQFQKNLAALTSFLGKTELPVSILAAPTSAHVLTQYLPSGAWGYDEGLVIEAVSQAVRDAGRGGTLFLDPTAALKAHGGEPIYFRTDHHWTMLGAYYAYAALRQAKGATPPALSEYEKTVVSSNFLGTLYSKNQLWGQQKDEIAVYEKPGGQHSISFLDDAKTADSLYFPEYLEGKDQYPYFIDGNHAATILKNSDPAASGKLLVVRDSYGHCFAPFLADDYAEVHLLDLRYFNLAPSVYAGQNGITEVLLLYSTDSWATDASLSKLR